jgi:hypothetical protein
MAEFRRYHKPDMGNQLDHGPVLYRGLTCRSWHRDRFATDKVWLAAARLRPRGMDWLRHRVWLTGSACALVIIGMTGYFAASQKPDSAVYTYRGYVFPDMPSGFAPIAPIPNVLFSYATVYYRTTGSLGGIEAEIGSICKDDNYYYPPGEWGGVGASGPKESYAAQAQICSTKNAASRWQFNISAGTIPDTYDVVISSEGPPVPVSKRSTLQRQCALFDRPLRPPHAPSKAGMQT